MQLWAGLKPKLGKRREFSDVAVAAYSVMAKQFRPWKLRGFIDKVDHVVQFPCGPISAPSAS